MTEEEADRWRQLEVWQMADDFAFSVYTATKNFPPDERFGVTSQIRRAALSVPTNIVEGYSRRGDRELRRFLDISLASLAETKYLLHFSRRLEYLGNEDLSTLTAAANDLGAKLWRFSRKVRADLEKD